MSLFPRPVASRSWVRHGLALLALVVSSTPASAQATFYGWQLAGGWPTGQMTAGSDWSSDLGPDWRYSATSNGSAVAWNGQGRQWSSRPYGPFEQNVTVGWEGDARGGAVGETYSGGQVTVGPTRVLSNGATARVDVHLWSVLGDNAPGYGISTDSRHEGYAALFLGPPPLDLYWRLDWTSAITGNAFTSAWLFFSGVFNQYIGGTTGSASGRWVYGGSPNGVASYPDLKFNSFAGDAAGDPRSGRIDTWVTMRLSTQPIAALVPEPSSLLLVAGGSVLLLGLRRRRR